MGYLTNQARASTDTLGASTRGCALSRTLSQSLVLCITVTLSAGGIDAQRPSRSRGGSTLPPQQEVTASPRVVRAQSGDTVASIAERYHVEPAEVARLNRLQHQSKLKKGQRLHLPPVEPADEPASGAEVVGKRIRFTDGGTLNVDEAWRMGSEVWFKRGGVTQRSDLAVKSIDPIHGPPKEVVKKSNDPPAATEPVVPSATWIYLVGGARLRVDQVNETSDGAWYNRNNLSVFLARDRIERIERDQPLAGDGVPAADWTSGSSSIDRLIRSNGNRFGVDPYLVFLVIEQESHFRPRVVSPKGAQGLMQLMPGTARRFGVKRPFEPTENIRGGTQYLKELLEMFGGRVDLALASYNAGEGRVIQYGHKVPPFRETRDYVRRISKRYGKMLSPRSKAPIAQSVPGE